MTREVPYCSGEYNKDILMRSCVECNDRFHCEGYKKYNLINNSEILTIYL